MPVAAASISNYDDIAYKMNANQAHTVSSSTSSSSTTTTTLSSSSTVNQRDNLEDNHDEQQPPYIQCSTAENLDSNQLQFFRTVNTYHLFLKK